MGDLPLRVRLRSIVGAIGWRLFCWGHSYPVEGFVCDFHSSQPLPCEGGDHE